MIGWGIGPRFGLPCVGYGIATVLLTRRFPSVFGFPNDAHVVVGVLGLLLVSVGVVIYLTTLGWFLAARKGEALVTTGPFRVVRHPLYATWLWLICPGIALLCSSWLTLGVIPVGYVAFRSFIKDEEDELECRFGREYEMYQREVSQIFPRLPPVFLSGHASKDPRQADDDGRETNEGRR